jgi:hypothetical protein
MFKNKYNINLEFLRNNSINLFKEGNINEGFKMLDFSIDIYNDISDYELKFYYLTRINNLNNIIKFLKNNENKNELPFFLKLNYLADINNFGGINILFNPKDEYRYFCYKCFDIIKNIELPELKQDLKYEAIIVEFRELKHLEFLIKNAILKIGNTWSFTIVCGNLNFDFILNITKNIKIKIIKLNYDNLNVDDYNKLMCTKDFWNLFVGEKLLIYEEDTFIFKSNIMDFIKWDYIGAPWPDSNDILVGNGGLSLRTKKVMIDIIENIPAINYFPHDLYFSKHINEFGKLADFISALKFSSEGLSNQNSFGGHCFFIYNYKWKSLILNNLLLFKEIFV